MILIDPVLGYVKWPFWIIFYVAEFHWAEVVEGLGNAFKGYQTFLETLLFSW